MSDFYGFEQENRQEDQTTSYGQSTEQQTTYGQTGNGQSSQSTTGNYYNGGGYNYYNTRQEEPKKPKKKKSSFLKKAVACVMCGVLLGGAAAGTFLGVMKATGYEAKLERVIEAANKRETVSPATPVLPAVNSELGTSTANVADIAESAMPCIVAITNTQILQNNMDYWSYFFNGGNTNREVKGAGSGIIIGQNETELLVLTNYHVIEDSTTLTVTFADGETYDAKVKGTAADNDLAVIAVPLDSITDDTMSKIKVITMGDSDNLRVGDEVIAIGNALGYGQSLTYGHVSALSRDVTIDKKTLTLLQTDAAINPGNSGGALLNMSGELIGINSAKYSDTTVEGMGFAIPISEAQDIIQNLMIQETKVALPDNESGYIGITGVDLDAQSAKMYNMPEGVYVYAIDENGPSVNSDLREKDIITHLNGALITNMEDLKKELTYCKGGSEASLTIQRLEDGEYKELEIKVVLGFRKDHINE